MIAHLAQAVIALMLWVVAASTFGGMFNIDPKHKVPGSARVVAGIMLFVASVFFGYGAFEMTKFALGV